MIFAINSEYIGKGKIEDIDELNGFIMGHTNKSYNISGCKIKKIKITSQSLASPFVTTKVMKEYHNLIKHLTNLLVDDDDDSGEVMQEVLNEVEKFRLEIKVKYRDYLKKKDLEMMAKQLMLLKKEAKQRLEEIRHAYLENLESKRSK